jgi:hypothetical protein
MRARGALSWAIALGAALVFVASAGARTYLPPGNHLFAGLTGGTSIAPFEQMVGKHPPVFEQYMTWDTSTAFLRGKDGGFRSRLGLAIGTSAGYAEPGVITPEQIALGDSDRFLVTLGQNLAHSKRIVYIRLMSEMNGYWNAYAAFDADGTYRGTEHSPHFYVEAWRRSVLILRGGPVTALDAKLRKLGLPPLQDGRRPPGELARPKVAFLWVPQDAGSPETAANSPGAFWPGSDYVDWVGTDFYASYPNFTLLDAFYQEFAGKPFVLSEWALYGADDPGFVRELFSWVAAHPRVRMLNYYQGFTAAGKPNLAHYPASRRVLRAELRASRFLAYAPEYAHPRNGLHNTPSPPRSPTPSAPPSAPTPVVPAPPATQPTLCIPLTKICIPGL